MYIVEYCRICNRFHKEYCINFQSVTDITKIPCSVACLWANMVWSVKPSRRDRENFVESINRLVDTGLIEIIEKSGEGSTLRCNSNVIFDISNLIHDAQRTYIKFDSKNLEKLVEVNYKTLTTLLQVYISIISYFNNQQINYFDNLFFITLFGLSVIKY